MSATSNERKLTVFIASSLDGYIAAKDESLEWLFKVEGEGDNGYSRFYDTVDTVIMGRKTYDWILKHMEGEFPYKGKQCYVFSKTAREEHDHVKFIQGDIASFTNRLKNEAGGTIWLVGGGDLIQSFAKEGLIDEWIITAAPTLIGEGIPLFKNIELELALKNVTRFNQFVELHYETKKNMS